MLAFIRSRSCAVAIAFTLVGCGGGGLKLTPIRNAQNQPSNVAAYFKVQTGGGDPVGGLAADQFKIYEDDQLVSQFESKQVILNPEVAASHYTMLLVDMSGSVAESGALDSVVDAAAAFAERVEKTQKVAVYAFDGCEKLHAIAPFQNPGGAAGAVRSLKSYKPDDPSTNLHGAIVKGIAELDGALAHAEHPMRFGTLVVFTDGTDRASRVSRDDMEKALDKSGYDVFAIGLGAEMKDSELKRVGKTGTAKADDKDAVLKAFDTIAAKIEASTKSFYLLSYCSPSRAGKHKLRIEAEAKDESGKSSRAGSFSTDFDATNFTHGCDPKQPPNFDVTKGDALAPPAAKKEERAQDKKPERVAGQPATKDKPRAKPPEAKSAPPRAGSLPPPKPPAASAAASTDDFKP